MPQNTAEITRLLQGSNQAIISDMFKDLIKSHKTGAGGRAETAYKRYRQDKDGVPVFKKKYANYDKTHYMIPNDFMGDIIDLKTGYMGNEVVIEVDNRKVPAEAEHQRQTMFLQDFAQRENTVDMNSELVKMAAITGVAYRLLFIAADDENSDAHMMNSDPWETVVYEDASLKRTTLAMRYCTMQERVTSSAGEHKEESRTQIEWYDREFVTYYRENDAGFFVLDTSKPSAGSFAGTGRQPHFFDGVPVIAFPNNEEKLSEVAKVLELIDAYDSIISDATSEVEQLRMAYMWIRGAGMRLSQEFQDQMEQTGVMALPEGGEIGFAAKNLGGASEFVQAVLSEIRRNIYSFAKSMDLSNDKGGDMRVIGWQISLLRLEMSAQVTERKFKKGYNQQYKLLTDFWKNKKGTVIDPMALRYVFTRKFPKDIDQEIDTLVKGMDVLPLEKLYSLMTFIDDPAELAKRFKEERPEMVGILAALDDATLVARNIQREEIRANATREQDAKSKLE